MLALPLVTACYVYEPVATAPPPPPGQDVRVRYSSDGPELVPWQRSLGRTATLQGQVLGWTSDAAILAVFPPPAAGMSRVSPHPDTVTIPVARISTVEQRQFSRGRTTAFAVGAGVVGAVIVRSLFTWTRRARDSTSGDS